MNTPRSDNGSLSGLEPDRRLRWVVLAGLAVVLILTWAIYRPGLGYAFLNWDDGLYVSDNPHLEPLSWSYVRYAFQHFEVGNYHPLTMLSYAWDMDASGPDPRKFKTTSLAIHLMNTVLVFLFIGRLFGHRDLALFAAASFALYPHHVEAVAWISGRKDLLATLFMLLSMLAYLEFIERKRPQWYVLAFLAFGSACLSKATAVTLPVLLLLLLWYKGALSWRSALALAPWFLAALVVGLVAMEAQESVNALDRKILPPVQRTLVTLGALGLYAWWSVVPVGMLGYHPYPKGPWALDAPLIWGIAFLGLLVLCLFLLRDRRALLGSACLVVTLLPVLQIMPVGEALMADRYTYMSGILFVPGMASIAFRMLPRKWVLGLLVVHVAWAMVATRGFLPTWADNISLWSSVTERHPGVGMAWVLLAGAWDERSDPPDHHLRAQRALEHALKAEPRSPHIHNMAGQAYQPYDPDKALRYFNAGILLDPRSPELRYNRASVLMELGDHQGAVRDLKASLRMAPQNAPVSVLVQAHADLGVAWARAGQLDSALAQFDLALHQYPDRPAIILLARASVHFDAGLRPEAMHDINAALHHDPRLAEAYHVRGLMLLAEGDTSQACQDLHQAFVLLEDPMDKQEVRAVGEPLCQGRMGGDHRP